MHESERPTRSSEELRALRAEVEVRRQRQATFARLFTVALGLVVGAGVVFRLPESHWMPLVGAIALAGLVYRLVNWKCPACGGRLGSRRAAGVCPECGLPLE